MGKLSKVDFTLKNYKEVNKKFFSIEKIVRKKKINGVEHGQVKWMVYDKAFKE